MSYTYIWASQVAQWWRIPLPGQETQVWSLDREDSLEKEMTIHSNFLAWRISWTEEPGGLQSTGVKKSWTQLSKHTNTHQLVYITIHIHVCMYEPKCVCIILSLYASVYSNWNCQVFTKAILIRRKLQIFFYHIVFLTFHFILEFH